MHAANRLGPQCDARITPTTCLNRQTALLEAAMLNWQRLKLGGSDIRAGRAVFSSGKGLQRLSSASIRYKLTATIPLCVLVHHATVALVCRHWCIHMLALCAPPINDGAWKGQNHSPQSVSWRPMQALQCTQLRATLIWHPPSTGMPQPTPNSMKTSGPSVCASSSESPLPLRMMSAVACAVAVAAFAIAAADGCRGAFAATTRAQLRRPASAAYAVAR